jgi:polysaccharide biosynthesis protein PelG
MAGIGFQIRKLARQETLSSVVAAAGHAAVIAAGPWLFTIFSLASITLLTDRVAGVAVLSDFRAVIIYAFASSLVLTAPVCIVTTRLAADALWLKRPQDMPTLMFGGFLVALIPTVLGVLVIEVYLGLALPVLLALLAGSCLVALIWIAIVFCGAIRDYRGVTTSFLLGAIVSLVVCVTAAIRGFEAPGLAWGFISGLTVTFFGLVSRVLATFPQPVSDPLAGVRAILQGLVRYWQLSLGALLATIGLWVDKWVFWLSPVRDTVRSGLLHAPIYDSSMFISSLIIIPSLAALVVRLETGFFERYQNYYSTIGSHGTLNQIEKTRSRLASYTLDHLTLITAVQAGFTGLVVLVAPGIIDMLGMQFRQITILRYGAMGSVFQFVYIAATSLLLFFDRRNLFLAVSALFCALNAGLAVLSIRLGEDYYGTGYFLACLVAGVVSFALLVSTLRRLNYLTFIGNNPSIVASSRALGFWQRWFSRAAPQK